MGSFTIKENRKVDQRNKSITLKINDTKTQLRISDDICIYMNKENEHSVSKLKIGCIYHSK